MTSHATGTFEVSVQPLALHEAAEGAPLGRLSIDKIFHGDLAGSSCGEMLSARTATDGSAGYVALEYVRGSLGGRSGSFVLQHSGTLTRGAPSLSVSVVPDSGTGELAGLAGSLAISMVDGEHHYAFDYDLPSS